MMGNVHEFIDKRVSELLPKHGPAEAQKELDKCKSTENTRDIANFNISLAVFQAHQMTLRMTAM